MSKSFQTSFNYKEAEKKPQVWVSTFKSSIGSTSPRNLRSLAKHFPSLFKRLKLNERIVSAGMISHLLKTESWIFRLAMRIGKASSLTVLINKWCRHRPVISNLQCFHSWKMFISFALTFLFVGWKLWRLYRNSSSSASTATKFLNVIENSTTKTLNVNCVMEVKLLELI